MSSIINKARHILFSSIILRINSVKDLEFQYVVGDKDTQNCLLFLDAYQLNLDVAEGADDLVKFLSIDIDSTPHTYYALKQLVNHTTSWRNRVESNYIDSKEKLLSFGDPSIYQSVKNRFVNSKYSQIGGDVGEFVFEFTGVPSSIGKAAGKLIGGIFSNSENVKYNNERIDSIGKWYRDSVNLMTQQCEYIFANEVRTAIIKDFPNIQK